MCPDTQNQDHLDVADQEHSSISKRNYPLLFHGHLPCLSLLSSKLQLQETLPLLARNMTLFSKRSLFMCVLQFLALFSSLELVPSKFKNFLRLFVIPFDARQLAFQTSTTREHHKVASGIVCSRCTNNYTTEIRISPFSFTFVLKPSITWNQPQRTFYLHSRLLFVRSFALFVTFKYLYWHS